MTLTSGGEIRATAAVMVEFETEDSKSRASVDCDKWLEYILRSLGFGSGVLLQMLIGAFFRRNCLRSKV